ncbi:MAG: toxin-activating lysine-acyltransferase [Sneathiella sp.]|nr:toxin-activating lysine-acyltransferase [Sneathiella sp.]
MGNISLVRPSPPIKAVGIALDLLHLQEPFSTWPAHELVSTVKGAIKRNHYILAKDDKGYVGVACWGLCNEETGINYTSGKVRPSFADCSQGENILLFIIHAQETSHLKAMVQFIKKYHPGFKVYARRFHQGKSGLSAKTVIIR